ncbi:MAG: hypothetical protein KAI07_04555, partial [Deltaproteobacteria bacterium]|nr:hypothetical protein [Deltaproteobacteria bacterium]
GDIHSKNAEYFGINRDLAKTIFYGLIYGSQVAKVRQILKCSQKKAKEVCDGFWHHNMALGKLRDRCIRLHTDRGFLPGLDNRRIYTRSGHSSLNALFQSGGAIIMANTIVLKHNSMQQRSWGSMPRQVVYYHDEGIDDYIIEEDKEQLTEIIQTSIKEAGERLKVRVPLTADVNYGTNWAEIH